ncbi:MAG: hypothetical protein RL653_1422 [Pseudomonadota bacterium]|jgi:diguanylate cyclase (GGDEF)-like protein
MAVPATPSLLHALAESCVSQLTPASEALAAWERSGDPRTLEPARTLFHRLAGTGALVGQRELGVLAATGEDLVRILQDGEAGGSTQRLLLVIRRHLSTLELWVRAEVSAGPAAATTDFPFMTGPVAPPLPPRDDDAALPFFENGVGVPPPPLEALFDEAEPAPDDVPRRVLVVDDDPICAGVLTQTLEAAGMSVRYCPDPREALELYERTAPDVVLVDLNMPGQDGITTCRQIRGHVDGDRAPILVVSRSAGVDDKVRALEAGADDYVTKPYEAAELRARIQAHALRYELQREQAFRDALTGAWNRRYLERVLPQKLSHAGAAPFCLALLDVDHFKQVNDVHGHPAGDDVLVALLARIRGLLRAEDLVGRLGGDELAILVSGADLPRGTEVLTRVVDAVRSAPIPIRGGGGPPALPVTVSAGITAARAEDSAEALFARADQALYASKRAGRDRVSPA